MGIYTKLENHAKRRPAELVKMKKDGAKIVGYIPEGYFPEELAYAAGAIPVALGKGGSYEMVAESLRYITRFTCTWCRTQIAYKMTGDIWYDLPELILIPTTDCNVKSIGDMFSYWSDTETMYYGVPHNKLPDAIDYYQESLKRVKAKLEKFTGNQITDEKLKAEINKQNTIRSLLKNISELRKAENPPITGFEFMKLQHYSMQADPDFLIECLNEIYAELKTMTVEKSDKIRLYLTGSTLAFGDYGLYEIVDQVGAEIVCEDFAGGVRNILNNVEYNSGDLYADLTDAYFTKRREGAWFRPSAHRVDYLIDDIKNYNCDGVIWYEMLYRESYDMQGFYFDKIIQEKTGVPMVKIETDYDASEKGNIKTRVETLCEIVIGGRQ
ncbi:MULTISPECIES: 2-hydroxyacyl-CoA dehydratase subunit D [Acetobacterium]|jgi:benzoyl-CoA reductase/2-hydroxyglutaryl-CoA dehydratase subunit BcrC/BadD/HgdB|uniref:2-hydroxyacyl-CoA dehydratase n=1 Tax=Acetobacterium wieringae TaxID=52694 RepID=A0A5D0WJA3_9FIRM|nr:MULTISPECIES: 2-hydroxyacyl-CoA dehydratase family protein [Acetobacterium]TYC84074.1 2-hydroxyacyl-CoA dehydratase [Acetobacterium wieringae]